MTTLEILADLQAAAQREAKGDRRAHIELLSGVQRLLNAVQHPIDRIYRERLGIYQHVCVRIAAQCGIFRALAKSDTLTAAELGLETNVHENYLIRIMRVLTLTGYADETGPGRYRANETTRAQCSPAMEGFAKISDIILRTCSNVGPAAERGLFNSPQHVDCFKEAYGVDFFTWVVNHKDYSKAFDDFMKGRRGTKWQQWWQVYPAHSMVENIVKAATPGIGQVLLVDVAGGQGHDTISFAKSLKNMPPGRLIVQDKKQVILDLSQDGIETMVYDIFKPQPILGAQTYLIKQVIHDWDDDKSRTILENIAQAMGEQSRLLINEYVLPAEKVGLRMVYMDIAMCLMMPGGMERSEAQWYTLVESAGLEIIKIWQGDGLDEGGEQVIECRRIVQQ